MTSDRVGEYWRRSREQADIARGDGGRTRDYTDEQGRQMENLSARFVFMRRGEL